MKFMSKEGLGFYHSLIASMLSGKAGKDVATTTNDGLMSATDKTKIDGIEANANNYTHPTTAGNKHIPSGGSSGQILRWSSSGTATWGTDNNTTYSNATTSTAGLMSATDKAKIDGITAGAQKNNEITKEEIEAKLTGTISSHTHTSDRPYSDTDPKVDGTAAQGTSERVSRQDHVHPLNVDTTTPTMNGTGSAGSASTYARRDHVHPTDTTREAAFTKKTAFNQNFETSTSNIKANGSVSVGSSDNVARADHIHPTDTTREPSIQTGESTQYWNGSKTWTDLATSVREVVLAGISTATNAAVSATDTILTAMGKLQAQLNATKSTASTALSTAQSGIIPKKLIATITESGNWVCPAGVTEISAVLVGGGGGGRSVNSSTGAPGGGSGYVRRLLRLPVTQGVYYPINIGTGGNINADGNPTSAFGYTVDGGKTGITVAYVSGQGYHRGYGGSGGSGGGTFQGSNATANGALLGGAYGTSSEQRSNSGTSMRGQLHISTNHYYMGDRSPNNVSTALGALDYYIDIIFDDPERRPIIPAGGSASNATNVSGAPDGGDAIGGSGGIANANLGGGGAGIVGPGNGANGGIGGGGGAGGGKGGAGCVLIFA